MATVSSQESLADLAADISKTAATVSTWLRTNSHPEPTLHPSGPSHFPSPAPSEIHAARDRLLSQTRLLQTLAQWPQEATLQSTFYSYIDASVVRWIVHFKLYSFVPLSGSIPFSSLAEKAGVPLAQMVRILRHAMTAFYFCEPVPGEVAHTAVSAVMAREPSTLGQLTFGLEVIFPSATGLSAATEKVVSKEVDGGSFGSSPFNEVFGTQEHAMAWTTQRPELIGHFSEGMRAFQTNPWYDVRHVLKGFDWEKLDNGMVVDVGGNDGATAVALLKRFPTLRCVVQDFKSVIGMGKKAAECLQEEVKERLEFMAADFLVQNPVKDADVYLLKNILHDWPDQDATRILTAQARSLKKGARIVIADTVLGTGDLGGAARWNRGMDIAMWSLMNGKERSREDFETLLKDVEDDRLEIRNIWSDPGSVISMIEIGWKGE